MPTPLFGYPSPISTERQKFTYNRLPNGNAAKYVKALKENNEDEIARLEAEAHKISENAPDPFEKMASWWGENKVVKTLGTVGSAAVEKVNKMKRTLDGKIGYLLDEIYL